jgi:4-amino-4-deoxy-L-arabinose transferase-like glycosyltransferase
VVRHGGGPLALLALPAVLAPVLALLTTRRHGLNISPDSVSYLAAAEGLARGDGVVGVDGQPLSLYAPGLPWLLALPARAGATVGAAQVLNLVLLAVLVFGFGWWLSRYVRMGIAVGTATAAAVSTPLLLVYTWLWSEPPFILLSTVYLTVLVRIARSDGPATRRVAVAGLLAAGATLIRYSGLSLLPIAAVVLLARRVPWRRRLADAAVFGVVFAVPVGGWLLRNMALTGVPTGERVSNQLSPVAIATHGLTSLTGWFVPTTLPNLLRAALLLVLAVLVVALAIAIWYRRPPLDDPRVTVLWIAGGYVVLAFTTLVVMTARTNVDPLGDRLLSPLVVPLLAALATAIDLAVDRAPRRASLLVATVAGVVLAVGFIPATARVVSEAGHRSTAYNTVAWHGPAMHQLLGALPHDAELVSNQPWAVHYMTGRPVSESPRKRYYSSTQSPPGELEQLAAALADGPVYLVWLDNHNDYHVSPNQLTDHFTVDQVTDTSTGAVYQIRPRR